MKIKRNSNSTYLLLVILLIILFFFLYVSKFFNRNKLDHFSNYSNYISGNMLSTDESNNMTYHRCSEKLLGKITKNIFDTNNIKHSNDNWNIYIPCGYNDVEEELKKILIKDKSNKYIFGLNGCDLIVSKNKIWESLVKCYGRKYASTLMPESYILDDQNEMEVFRANFNPSANDIYILKKNVQRKEGLKLTRDFFEIIQGVLDEYRVAQKYITNLYLVNQRKVNLRIYLLVIIKDSIIYFYLCKDGKCIYTNKKYNDNDLDFESNITSYNLNMSVYKESPRDFDQLKVYINKDTQNKESGNFLFNNIELLMKEVASCLSKSFYQSKNIKGSITFQLFGADVIFNNELHPYLLEMNKGPDMTPRDDIDEKMKTGVQFDMFKTVGIMKNDKIDNSFYLIYKNSI